MKKLSFINKVIFTINVLVALLLLMACLCPFVSVSTISFLPFLGLASPVLVIVNLIFLMYWLLQFKRQFTLSFFVLLLGYFTLGTFIRFGDNSKEELKTDLTILSYNVRGLNKFEDIESNTVFEDIESLVENSGADIVCLQESANAYTMRSFDYPHKYASERPTGEIKTSLSIFSKYPIIKAETLYFPNTVNNACYVDVLVQNDTIRVYSLHMQSLGITPGSGIIRKSSSQKLYKKLTSKFEKQEKQASIIAEHSKSVSYKTIICGDFNNNQYSRTYNLIKGNKKDTFDEVGQGYGRTFNFHRIPVRIDFILADPRFEVVTHKNFNEVYSDHFPIMASFRLN
ncbi:endonuclease/exonuclease/phosphatase family protein [Aurantibacter crassamenti]|uniref:endonuclease/exonuclease/phosphatase family protein n=1 Tax=Aurantibacter crassamenti TaxID=1837375 RepID=UPI00193A89D6|nr:endonuclease/exonuclease/phosphatase family protein [Aurantibacter crassamenti]MBM1106700.1 endonuclease/exonuclease/phosphatase family protein [Aurantibacter crassamenti]